MSKENEKTLTLEERFAHLEQIVARMEDADKNSKSLVLITRVGSTPTTGIEKPTERHSQSAFLFNFSLVHQERRELKRCKTRRRSRLF